MEIAFSSRALRSMCVSSTALKKTFGDDAGGAIRTFLSDIRAANNVEDIVNLGITTILTDDKSIKFDVGSGIVVKAEINHAKPPLGPSGRVVWVKVYRLKLVGVEHG